MLRRSLFVGFVMVAVGLGAWAFFESRASAEEQAASAATTKATASATYRQQIRALPILERPNRFGHFYGNSVRRANGVYNGRG